MQVSHKQCALAVTRIHTNTHTHHGDFCSFQSCKQLDEEWCIVGVSHPEIIKPLIYWEPAVRWSNSQNTHTHTNYGATLHVYFLCRIFWRKNPACLRIQLPYSCYDECVHAHMLYIMHTHIYTHILYTRACMCAVFTSPQACLPAYFTLMPQCLCPR